MLFSSLALTAEHQVHPQVAKLLQANTEPDGVVFDIETLDKNALKPLTTYVITQVELLKKAFPNVDIAMVSHGAEEFSLQTTAKNTYSGTHNLLSELASESGVSVHVCGAVGALKQLTQEDFPDFVSYSASGLAQINDYKALGYSVIVIKQLNNTQRKALFDRPDKFIK